VSYAADFWQRPEHGEAVSLAEAQAVVDMLCEAEGMRPPVVTTRRPSRCRSGACAYAPTYSIYLGPQRRMRTVAIVIHELAHLLSPPQWRLGVRRDVHGPRTVFRRVENRLFRRWRGEQGGQ